MTEEQRIILERIANELGGKLYTSVVTDKYTEYKKIVIEYAKQKR